MATPPAPMPSPQTLFRDRTDAGRQLSDRLEGYREEDPIVLALPRGGVVLGYEIAEALDAPLDVVVARKVGAPMQPELGIGAVAPGVTLCDTATAHSLGVSDEAFEELAEVERVEMRRRLRHYRGDDELPDVRDRTVILVDDGLATGVTAVAAIHAVREGDPRRVVLAVGVCAASTADSLSEQVDDLVCVATPEPFWAVGMWYHDFNQTSDEEVMELLHSARRRHA